MALPTTPVPNLVLDKYLAELSGAEFKLLLVIIRQTFGWQDKKSQNSRKQKDWISGSQLKQKTGCSPRAIGSATQSLIDKRLIEVSDDKGWLLHNPEDRRGQSRLYYKTTSAIFSHVDNMGKKKEIKGIPSFTNALFAEDIRKKVTTLTQKIRITK